MSNPSFKDNTIKIGISSNDPTQRKKELYSTGVPEPFKIEYYALVEDYENIEKVVHQELTNKRPNKNREFFNCSIEDAVLCIKYNARIISENSFYQSHLNIKIQEEINQRKNTDEFLLKFDKSMNDISDEFNQKIKLQKKENTTSNAIINEKNSIENTTVSKNPVRKEPLYKESKNFYLLLFFLVIAIAFAVKYWGYSLLFLYLLLLHWFISSASGANSSGDGAGSDY